MQVEIQRLNVTDLSPTAFDDLQSQLEMRIDSIARKQRETLQRTTEQLLQVKAAVAGNEEFSQAEMTSNNLKTVKHPPQKSPQ